MSLSNTATPIYYGEFRDKVLRGEIPVNQEISMEMNRIDALIANPGIYYDPDPVEGFISYCENELTLTDGSDVNMLDSFKLWGEEALCWFFFEDVKVYQPGDNGRKGFYKTVRQKRRLVNKQFLIVGRGAAKSLYMSYMQSYMLNVDTTTTHQITTAPTMKLAEEVISPIRTSILRSKGPLFKFLTDDTYKNPKNPRGTKEKLASTKKGIENLLTGSYLEVRPMTINKLQGLRVKMATVDEWLSGDLREDPIGAIEQGASKVADYLIIAASSEGTVRNGSGDDIKMELLSILKGDYYNPRVSIFYYRMDDIKELPYPNLWLKCNPNLGATVSYATYQQDLERAEKVPSARNDILAKRFGIPSEGYTYFFRYDETLLHSRHNYQGLSGSLGGDLSKGDDFCSFTFLFPLPHGYFGVKTRNYITERTMFRLPASMRDKYNEFIKEGSLIIMTKPVLDVDEVYDDIDRHIQEMNYDIRCLGYDPYNAKNFVTAWTRDNGPYGILPVPQGTKTESVPLGELKTLAEDRCLIFDEAIMSFAMGNAITLTDSNGGRKLSKRRSEQKIDPVAALMDAYVAYKDHKELFD